MERLWSKKVGQHWFFSYKLHHIPFWCLYHYIWLSVAFGNPYKAAANIAFLPYGLKYAFYVVFEALAVYFNFYFLIPKYLETRQHTAYFAYLSLTIVATALFIVSGYYFSSMATGRTLGELYGENSNCFYYFMGYALPSAFASMTLAMTIKLLKINQQRELEKRKPSEEQLTVSYQNHFLTANNVSDYPLLPEPAHKLDNEKKAVTEDHFFIRCGTKYEKVIFDEILYVESMQNYVNIFTAGKRYTTLNNLKSLEKYLDATSFLRVHKSYMVSIKKIDMIEGNEIFIQSHRIPISRSYRDAVLDRVVNNRLLDKK
ncbi:LytR/AlgR family response regulator transcription factor [Dyadobacter psychrophilus]|uniref:LytTr DNA-binding domain-containing protein n=1 Tax=Dyadobacter psychrophilus TaxID=651661 RepID=A0A1T5EU79_9BACT|nr:LytTR family DNA-binding domain-containing protein [Dyadobacter psychrophilus]SKB87502.1 LytTr DNA-binding domain-containing protein [Dyadobacter psychrophilus]